MRKRLTSFLLCFFLCVSLLPVSAQAAETTEANAPEIPTEGDVWDGSITPPTKLVQIDGIYYYEITKCSELAYVAQTGGGWMEYNYILGNNLILNSATLTWDENGTCDNNEISLNKWTPIGTVDDAYIGIFDGDGYTISGMYINSNVAYCGLFGNCDYAQIRNLAVKNSYVLNTSQYSGGLIASSYYCNIEDCSFSGCVVGRQDSGGLIGLSTVSTVLDCHTEGLVISKTNDSGGMIASCNSDSIRDSSSFVSVFGVTSAGGFVGAGTNGEVEIENCVSFGDVSGSDCVGGFAGFAYNISISNCAAFGSVSATDGAAGGFAGKTENKYYGSFIITNCYSFGNATATTYAGGFVGICGATISQGYSVGEVDSTNYAGGFIGEDRRIWGEDFSIESCYYIKDNNYNSALFGTSIASFDTVGEIEGKSSAQLKVQSTFSDWDFTDVWSISSDKNGGYPYLQWQENALSDIAVNNVEINETALTLTAGDYAYLTATVSPANASNKSVTWKSSDSDIATVSSAGKVTAFSTGTAVITATTVDGGYTATCAVTVTERMSEEYKINSITVRDNDGAVLSEIPSGTCLATVSITNLASEGNTLVFLAAYTSTGQYQGMMWVSVEDLPIGATIKVTLPVDNADGKIENLKAFTVTSFSNLTPLGEAVSFLP